VRDAWYATFERCWDDVVRMGGRTFAEGRMGVDQILAMKPGTSGMLAVR